MSDDRIEGYARGLLEVARAEGVVDQVGDELFAFARALESSDELRQALTDPQLPLERRLAIVEELLGDRAHAATTSLAAMVVGAGRARDLPRIADRLVEEAAAERQHTVAEVRSAVPLDDEQRRRLADALGRATGKEVEVKVVVDESVLGGLVARIGDTVIDGTVRRRLDQLKHAL